MSFADKVKKLVEEAPVASGGVNVNFGPLTITPVVVRWAGRGNQPTKTPLDAYMKEHGLKDSDDIELEQGKESFMLQFDIDVSELNPSLNFHYERDVEIKESGQKIKTDWTETVRPALEKVFGKDWYNKVLPNGKKAAPVFYVSAENVDSVIPPKEGKKNYGVPKLLEVYEDLDACRAARDLRYPPRDESGEPVEGNEDDDGDEFPEDILEQVRTLYDAYRKNEKKTKQTMGSHPDLKEYDTDKLFDAAIEE